MKHIEQRLAAVRRQMAAAGYDALIIPRADEFLGEYIPAHNERLQWISGFNGSAGVAIILRDSAAIFVDGRYTVQVRKEVPPALYDYHHLNDEPHIAWLQQQVQAGGKVAYDPRMHSLTWQREAVAGLGDAELVLVATTQNLIDLCWDERPEPIVAPAILLAETYTGEDSHSKRCRIGETVAGLGANAALIFAPDSVSWLLNIRGTDVPCLPIVQSFAILECDGSMLLFVNEERIPEGFADHVGAGVKWVPETQAEAIFERFRGQTLVADPFGSNAWTQLALEASGAILLAADDPVQLPKACKNAVEIQGARDAHIRDAVAETRFLAWLDAEVAAGSLHDEATLSDQLYAFRAVGEQFRGSSFDTISAAGPNAAMCHYNHLNGVPAPLAMNTLYLLDSGAQYSDGTTDITRTVAIGDPGDEARRMYTLVLKGHIALAMARFPRGTAGCQLDVLARQFLWREGFDYDHGTGHGVGSFLSVHEGPQRIGKKGTGVPLCPGMIVSNEPGYYRDGCYGIRCENLVVVRECPDTLGETPCLEFETITLVPFDNRLLLPAMLTRAEYDWLNNYHVQVRETLDPLLEGGDRDWLRQATKAVAHCQETL